MRKVKDGWHKIKGYDVYIENGYVLRGTLGEGSSYRPAYVYRACKDGSYTSAGKLSVDAFSAGIRRGTITLR